MSQIMTAATPIQSGPIRISVIIPAYNEEKLISSCLQALRQQTLPADQFEVIVVDNDSQDRTAALAAEGGVKVVSYTKAHTVGAVRNAGAAQAQGSILAFVDADTIPSPNWLQDISLAFTNTQLMAVGGVGLPAHGNVIDHVFFQLYNLFCIVNQWIGVVLVAGFNMAIRRTAFDQVGGFDESLKSAEDIDLFSQVRQRYGRQSIAYNHRITVYTSTRKMKDGMTMLKYIRDGAINYFNIVLRRPTKGRPMIHVR